jgi:hypothetical protein
MYDLSSAFEPVTSEEEKSAIVSGNSSALASLQKVLRWVPSLDGSSALGTQVLDKPEPETYPN